MDRFELLRALRGAGVDDSRYGIQGLLPSDSEGGPLLVKDDEGRWAIGSQERGTFTIRRAFDAEHEACQYMYDMLTRPKSAPVKLIAEEAAQAAEAGRRQEEKLRQLFSD